jgi:hypothetical protein
VRSPPPLVVLLDEGAPVGLALPFEARGHRVIRHSEVLAPGASDRLVAAQAGLNGAALVAVDRDMRQMAKRFGNPASAPRVPGLHLIFIACNAALAPKRVAHFMSLIELEWRIAHEKVARAMWIEIAPHHVRSHR